ncbi:MAG: right-handed parallel beta-helix repeat-containing protein, partial [Kiritimatiellae bacterium]|nr:right-handed parallel beta-helix repeat-containing protein [Kiritimatiellia bacterium]
MSQETGITFYVAPDGDDHWSGKCARPNADRTDGPFATPARARDAVRVLTERSVPVTVLLRGGTYFLDKPLRFTPVDSGTATAPVTYAAYPGETPILSAGQRLGGWEETELPCQPVDNWGKGGVTNRRAWVTEAPQGFFRQLWVNGSRRSRTRVPHRGMYHVTGLPEGWPSTGSNMGAFAKFHVNPDVLGEWRNLGDVEMVLLVSWIECRMPLVTADRKAGLVETAAATPFLPILNWEAREFSPFYLENIFEALTEPGEWYLDRETGKLYYLPLPEETPETAEVIAPRLPHVIVIAGDPDAGTLVEHLHFRGLTLAHNEWQKPADQEWWRGDWDFGPLCADAQAAVSVPGAFEAAGMRHGSISHCTVAHGGSYAIQLGRGCRDNLVNGCDLFDLGAGGVKLGTISVEDAKISGHNEISDCRVHNSGLIFHSAVGLWVGQSGDNLLAHNEINHLYYTGISLGWRWDLGPSASHNNVVEYNHIHDIGQGWLSDMGGIYTLGDSSGTVLRYNLIHHVEHAGYGGFGIYHDGWSSNILEECNLIYRCTAPCLNFQRGHGNVARNNILAMTGE